MSPGIFLAVNICLAVFCVADMFVVMRRDLMMLQQNSYRNGRYVNWFNQSNESTSPWRLGACIALFLLLVNHIPQILSAILASIILLCNTISFLRKKYKKPLVFTSRAIRIYIVLMIISLGAPIVLGICTHSLYLANEIGILVIILSPIFLLLANILLMPLQNIINNKYIKEAKHIIESNIDLKIIGITGSYGKTSTKHFLYHLLREEFETVMTPGSYNTLLGVTRTVRESLKPYTQIFIAEMGAKQPNDIKEICDLVHPQIGIVTSIGEQHLESFKTIENVLKTKFELIDSLPNTGLAVINISNPIVEDRVVTNVPYIYYGGLSDRDISNIIWTKEGTSFDFRWANDEWIKLKTPLLGRANIENLTAALIVARYLSVRKDYVIRAVATMPQVEHRLQIIHTPGHFTILDDAFNSNPIGAKMALEVLNDIAGPGKKFIITPGMIELGSVQEEKNREFGKQIGNVVDYAILVGDYNQNAILEGLELSSFPESKIFTVRTFLEAQKLMLEKVSPGDVVLLENDLPDTFK